jgi:hypothetical protein
MTIGSVSVLPSECEFSADLSSAKIVVESNNKDFPRAIEDLQHMDVRKLAAGYAASQGVADPRLSSLSVNTYPVNAAGVSLDRVKDADGKPLPPRHPDMQPAKYRAEFRLSRKLV